MYDVNTGIVRRREKMQLHSLPAHAVWVRPWTGITRMSKGYIFSDLNNLEVVTTTSEKYKVKYWYDGFRFGSRKEGVIFQVLRYAQISEPTARRRCSEQLQFPINFGHLWKCQTLSGKLSWSHYCELLSISDADKRSFYEKESINCSDWA